MKTALISGRLARARSSTSIPDIDGIAKSTISRSITELASSTSSAALPLEASSTLYPLSRKISAVISRTSSLSSTNKILAVFIDYLGGTSQFHDDREWGAFG